MPPAAITVVAREVAARRSWRWRLFAAIPCLAPAVAFLVCLATCQDAPDPCDQDLVAALPACPEEENALYWLTEASTALSLSAEEERLLSSWIEDVSCPWNAERDAAGNKVRDLVSGRQIVRDAEVIQN